MFADVIELDAGANFQIRIHARNLSISSKSIRMETM